MQTLPHDLMRYQDEQRSTIARGRNLPSLFLWLWTWRRRRDARAYAVVGETRDFAARLPGSEVLFVQSVYQEAWRGTKAVVYLERSGQVRDAWFWWDRVHPGQMALVQASTGYGPHTPREDVLYVGSERTGSGIHRVISKRDVKHARRHYKRGAR
jgi:hypothetical protein